MAGRHTPRMDRILVVGGGIAGLSTAIALRRRGYAPELVEARKDWPGEGAAITLHANGVRALRRLGLGEALDRAAAFLPQWTFHDATGNLLCATDLVQLWGDAGPCLGIARARLQRILVAAADRIRIPCRLGVTVTALTRHSDRVWARFGDGTVEPFDLVVGADGIRSTVRRFTPTPAEPDVVPLTAWRSVAPGRPDGVTGLTLLMGDGCFLGLVPVGDGDTYGFAGAVTNESAAGAPNGRLACFRARFAGFGGPVPAYLASLRDDRDIHSGPVEQVTLDRWHDRRVVLVGDAAHATAPHMGQGGSPHMLAIWGRNDPYFIPAGAHAYRRDTPDAEIVLLDTGHFALEEEVETVAATIDTFLTKYHH
jgi:2-polyprenyl-6-methoxyphenol hydroxylase-like FAD-dependent oxidoreductase